MFKRSVLEHATVLFLCERMYDWCSWFTLKGIYIVWTQRSQCLGSILRSKIQLRLSFLFWIAFPFPGRVLLSWSKPYSFLGKETLFLKTECLFTRFSSLPKSNTSSIILKNPESGNQQEQWDNIMFKQAIPIPCEIIRFDSKTWVIPNLQRYKTNRRFKLQSAQNLHRDKKKQKFWVSKCTKPAKGQKKHKFWTSKCTKPAQGQKNKSFELQSAPNLHRDKKNKNFTIYVGRGDYPSKVLFFLFFLSLCRFGAFWNLIGPFSEPDPGFRKLEFFFLLKCQYT